MEDVFDLNLGHDEFIVYEHEDHRIDPQKAFKFTTRTGLNFADRSKNVDAGIEFEIENPDEEEGLEYISKDGEDED